MMTAYVISVNPNDNLVTWSGMCSEFELSYDALDVSQSTITCPKYTGDVDDIIAFVPIDGFGYIPYDKRCGDRGYSGPAFYYGVVTSVNTQTYEVTCADFKKYLDVDYAEEPITAGKYSKPMEYFKDLISTWTMRTPVSFNYLSDMPWSGNYTYPSPEEISTVGLMDTIVEGFKKHRLVPVIYGDVLKLDKATKVSSHAPYTTLFAAMIQGEDAGTLVIDKSSLIKDPDVYVRPTMNGEPNGIHIVKVNFDSNDKYQSLNIDKRYITKDSNIVSDVDNENIIRPVKMKTVIYQEQSGTISSSVRTESDGSTVLAYLNVNWEKTGSDNSSYSDIKYSIVGYTNRSDDTLSYVQNVKLEYGVGGVSQTAHYSQGPIQVDREGTYVTQDQTLRAVHLQDGTCPLYLKISADVSSNTGWSHVEVTNSFDLPSIYNNGAKDAIAREELMVPRYSHEISFRISKQHPQVNKILKLGNKVAIIYKMKTYESVVNGFTISSDSEFIQVTCGNITTTLANIIGGNNVGGSVSIAGGTVGGGGGSGSGVDWATEADIDNIIDSIFIRSEYNDKPQ